MYYLLRVNFLVTTYVTIVISLLTVLYRVGVRLLNTTITVPKRVAKRIREEARRLGVTSEEYLIELITQGLDPKDRAVEYIESAKELLQQSREELEGGNVRQAAEKAWCAAALAVKAYAEWREGRKLASHGELWEYKRIMQKEVGEWVHNAWMNATGMHICFYEGWCARKDVENAYKRIEKLVKEIASKIKEKNLS